MVSWLRDDRNSLAVNGHLCCCVQRSLHLLRCHMDHPHRWPGFWLRFVLLMQWDKVLERRMPFNPGPRFLVKFSYHRAVLGLAGLNLRKFLLFLMWTRPNLEQYKNLSFCATWKLTLSPRSATETDLEETLGGEDDAAEGEGDDDIAVSVFSFLGDLVQVSPFDVDSRSSE